MIYFLFKWISGYFDNHFCNLSNDISKNNSEKIEVKKIYRIKIPSTVIFEANRKFHTQKTLLIVSKISSYSKLRHKKECPVCTFRTIPESKWQNKIQLLVLKVFLILYIIFNKEADICYIHICNTYIIFKYNIYIILS